MKSKHRHNEVHVPCHDQLGRRRDLAVAIDEHGNVTVSMQTGETAVLSHMQVGRLRSALRDAAIASPIVSPQQRRTA